MATVRKHAGSAGLTWRTLASKLVEGEAPIGRPKGPTRMADVRFGWWSQLIDATLYL